MPQKNMKIGIINAVFQKQVKEIVKNPEILVLYIVYPVVALFMTQAMKGTPQFGAVGFFVAVFGTMHVVFSPIVVTASIIAEEKEKNTLRVLIMANVKPLEYLLSIGSCVFLCTMVTGCSFLAIGGYTGMEAVKLLLCMGVGSIVSILVGMTIGTSAKSVAGVNGIAVPAGFVFAFTPMLAAFSEPVKRFSNFLFGQRISSMIGGESLTVEGMAVILINFIIFLIIFVILYKKNRLDA